MLKQIEKNLIIVLREFGPIGLITYVGGSVILYSFFFSKEINKQILYAIVGVLLMILSVIILCLRIKQKTIKEKALIDMVTYSSNRLAEKLNENVKVEQTTSITQTIWQTQKDLMDRILKQNDSN